MLRPRANEIPQLVRRLGSSDAARADAARARLAVLGARAVEDLILALEGRDRRIRERVMPLLALIGDARGRAPLIATLLDDEPAMRALAAECLARFPAPDVVLALERTLLRDAQESVRVAAVRALVEHCSAGRDDAMRRPLELLLDPTEGRSMRVAAFLLVRALPVAQQPGILARLGSDADDEIRRLARAFDSEPSPKPCAIEDLASPDYARWNAAVRQLGRAGAAAVTPLVGEICRRPADPEFATRAGMALKALGRRHALPIADALDRVDDPLALHVLVDVIGAIGEPALVYRLKDVLDRITHTAADGTMRRVRAKSHLELARIGSRVAIHDLRHVLGDPSRPLELELLAAVELVGTRDEIPVLLGAFLREEPFVAERIAYAVRTIMKRERIRRDDRTFQRLGPGVRDALDRILPRPATKVRRAGRLGSAML
jgi:HEAT repeat protein